MKFPIISYHHPVPAINETEEALLIAKWHTNWRAWGFMPHVINEYWAIKHPLYAEYFQVVASFPSCNPGRYDYHCWMRWLAVAAFARERNFGRFAMADYDLFNHGWAPPKCPQRLVCYSGHVPCLVTGNVASFEAMAKRFMKLQPQGDHYSDMLALQDLSNHIEQHHYVTNATSPKGVLVHYSNSVMQPAGQVPRHHSIDPFAVYPGDDSRGSPEGVQRDGSERPVSLSGV